MEPLTIAAGLFIYGLYKATEKIWEKGLDAAWTPVDEALKTRFTRWAGRGQEAERRAAFEKAAAIARANTLRTAADPQQAGRILDALNGERDKKGAEALALAEEAAKLMLFSAVPDVPRLTALCRERLHWDAIWSEGAPPDAETVAFVLSDFLTNLREALLDQKPHHDLVQREMLRALRQIVAELRPVTYDDEAAYRFQMAEMHRRLEFVGIPELKERRPITVEDIFINLRTQAGAEEALDVLSPREVRILQLRGGLIDGEIYSAEEIALKFGLTEEEALAIEGDARARLPQPIEFLKVHEAVQRHVKMVILGDPGAGKTMLLHYLTAICAEGRAEAELGLQADGGTGCQSILPVFIPLCEFAAECAERSQDYCLLDYLYTHAREHLLLNLPPDFFEDALEAGRGLVCLDGLDEVWAVRQRKQIADAVRALATRFPRSRYIVTSRIVGYDEAPLDRRDFTHHTILPLSDDDVREFVRKWYAARERDPMQRKQKTDDLIATIEHEPRIRQLTANPLLLTIIALVHRIEAELPHERVKLYDKCVTALVETWEDVKGLTLAEKQRPFYRQRRRLLERLAYELHAGAEEPGQLRMVKGGDLELLLARFLTESKRLGLADDPDAAREEARALVRLVRGRTGLLVERGEGVFGFPHLTFQEYLAACDLENHLMPYGVEAVWKEIKPRLHDPHWREVILLLLGSLNRYEGASTLLVERILETGTEDEFEPVLHRHLYLAARALADRVAVADVLHRQVVDELLAISSTAPWWEGSDALTTLSWLKGDRYAADGLLALARDQQAKAAVRFKAVIALGTVGCTDEALHTMRALAQDQRVEAQVRHDAAKALWWVDHAEEEAVGVLLNLVCDSQVDPDVRYTSARTLAELGHTEEVVEVLWALARDLQVMGWTRLGALQVLGQLVHTKRVVSELVALARDPQMIIWVRTAAVETLGRLEHVEGAGGVLVVLICDPQVDFEVRCSAARALGQRGHSDAKEVDSLLALARDHQAVAEVRCAIAEALAQLGHAEEATEILLAIVHSLCRADEQSPDGFWSWRSWEDDACFAAAAALARLGRADEATKALLALARDPQVMDTVRCNAAEILAQLGYAEEAKAVLLMVIRHLQYAERSDPFAWELLYYPAHVLGRLGHTEEAAEVLVAIALNRKVLFQFRKVAVAALGDLDQPNGSVLDSLLTLARNAEENVLVRRAAYDCLKRLVGTC